MRSSQKDSEAPPKEEQAVVEGAENVPVQRGSSTTTNVLP